MNGTPQMTTLLRPKLAEVSLSSVWPPQAGRAVAYATMSVGQWDETLHAAYDLGYVLLELDDQENIVRAYKTVGLN